MLQRLFSLCRRLVGGERPASTADKLEDRRVWVRHPCDKQTVVQARHDGSDAPLPGRVRNVSRGGINLVVDREFTPGDMISVELPRNGSGSLSTVLACVVHSQAIAPGQWSLGCSFAGELTEEELAIFGARRERPTPPDNRGWVRFGCQVRASYQAMNDPRRPSGTAQVSNISAGGIGLVADQPIETGTLLSLDLQKPGGEGARTVLACVVHVVAREREWQLGCNFIHELNEADLKALL